MKKLLVLLISTFLMSGCSVKSDNMEDIDIYTSAYPIEYITESLYGDHSNIYSIYPTGVNIHDYMLTKNQINNYSKSGLFIYTGLMQKNDKNIEAEYASSMIDKNKKIRIIDASKGMEYNNDIEEIWLNPSNMLMMANNVVSGLNEYISNPYLIKDINKKYTTLQTELSALDAEFKELYENANTKTIVVSSDAFMFLEKYNFKVISLEENDDLTSKTISDVRRMIFNGDVKYIFIRDDEDINYTINNLVTTTDAKTLKINMMTSISEVQKENKEDYNTIMKSNIQQFQLELYK